MLFINPNWCWQFETNTGFLQLCLSTAGKCTQLCTGLQAHQLRDSPVSSSTSAPLTLEQAGMLTEFLETMDGLVASEVAMQAAVRILAQQQFAAKSVQKSHYFDFGSSHTAVAEFSLAKLSGQSQVAVLVYAIDTELADCLLLDSVHTLNGKELPALCCVRVQVNRLTPLQPSASSCTSYLLSA